MLPFCHMKRDMDLVRQLLLYFEEAPDFAMKQHIAIDGHTNDEVVYHLLLMAQAGFIDFEASRSSTNPERLIGVYPFNLTWFGHEFLARARNEKFWNRAKNKIADAGGGLSVALIQALLESYAKEAIGLSG